jgi:hypothetical protein
MQQIEKLPDTEISFQHDAFIRGDRASVVLPQQLADVFRCPTVKFDLQEQSSYVPRQSDKLGSNGSVQDVCLSYGCALCHGGIITR